MEYRPTLPRIGSDRRYLAVLTCAGRMRDVTLLAFFLLVPFVFVFLALRFRCTKVRPGGTFLFPLIVCNGVFVLQCTTPLSLYFRIDTVSNE